MLGGDDSKPGEEGLDFLLVLGDVGGELVLRVEGLEIDLKLRFLIKVFEKLRREGGWLTSTAPAWVLIQSRRKVVWREGSHGGSRLVGVKHLHGLSLVLVAGPVLLERGGREGPGECFPGRQEGSINSLTGSVDEPEESGREVGETEGEAGHVLGFPHQVADLIFLVVDLSHHNPVAKLALLAGGID